MRQTYVLLFVMVLVSFGSAMSQISFTQPPPGSVYREYSRVMSYWTNDWRVTAPDASNPRAAEFLPNPVLDLSVGDLQYATRAEAVLIMWGGHEGTTGKAIRFNGAAHSWIPIPNLGASNGIPSGNSGECYLSEPTATVDVPIGDLIVGTNQFEGTNAGQTCGDFGWGQFGWYGIILRVYYDPALKPHPTGSITSPSNGSSFGDNPTINASASGGAGVNRVDFLAYYDGYDTDGDGISQEYHHDYHMGMNDASVFIQNHVGTVTGSPWQITWTTTWVPDQAPGSVKLLARIRDSDGIWYVTPEIQNLTLNRPTTAVRMYKAENVPSNFTVRGGIDNASCTFTIPQEDNLSMPGSEAALLIRTWNGNNGGAIAPEDAYSLKVNNWTAPLFGQDHFYSYDILTFSPSQLTNGTNTMAAYCNSVAHGVEYLWPGPALVVRFNGPLPVQLIRFAAVAAVDGGVRLTWSTVSETNNYGFEVQKAFDRPADYHTIPNSFVAGHGTTLDAQHYSFTDVTSNPGRWYYRLKQTDLDGAVHYSDGVLVETSGGVGKSLPTEYGLTQNYPNPFNPSTVIQYALPVDAHVRVDITNLLGEVLFTLVNDMEFAGYHNVRFDGANLPSGLYFYRLSTGNVIITKKMVLIK